MWKTTKVLNDQENVYYQLVFFEHKYKCVCMCILFVFNFLFYTNSRLILIALFYTFTIFNIKE